MNYKTLALALLLSTSTTAGFAAEPPRRMATVTYQDVNLAHPSGRLVLMRRVERAVERVCPEQPAPNELRSLMADRACHREAWDSVRPQLDRLHTRSAQQGASLSVAVAE